MPRLVRIKEAVIKHVPCIVCDVWEARALYTYYYDQTSSNAHHAARDDSMSF